MYKSKCIAIALIVAAVTTSAQGENGSFSTLSYNIAGLPEAFSSAESNRQLATEEISCYVNQFDVVNVQEDFNYHAAFYDACNVHPYRSPTTGGMGFGSGLNTLSHYAFPPLQRVRWKDCNGVDCLTPKGFTKAQIRLAQGLYIDVYNLHAQAQVADADLTVRRKNIEQLLDYIHMESSGNAVIVMGDTNTRYTRGGDNIWEMIHAGFSDAWVEQMRGGEVPAHNSEALVCDPKITAPHCELIDKVLYRNNAYLQLTPIAYQVRQDDELVNGLKYSDHPPIAVEWHYSTNSRWSMSDSFGGQGGRGFNDINTIEHAELHTLGLRAGSRVDQINVVLDNGVTRLHGGGGGSLETLELAPGEYLQSASACQGEKNGTMRIFHASFATNFGRTLTGGRRTSDCREWRAPEGWKINGFHGRAGGELDQLGVIFSLQ